MAWDKHEDEQIMSPRHNTANQAAMEIGRSERQVELRAKQLGREFNNPLNVSLDRAMHLGYVARKAGKRKSHCPPYSTLGQKTSWCAGWHTACQELGDPCHD